MFVGPVEKSELEKIQEVNRVGYSAARGDDWRPDDDRILGTRT